MNTLFFWISKLVWGLMSPDSLIVVLLLIVWLLLWRKKLRWAKWLLGVLLIGLVFVGLFPVDEWLLYPLETRFPTNPELPQQVDGIIVLGGAVDPTRSGYWNQVEMNQAAERLVASAALARRYPHSRLVFTGGSGKLLDQAVKEATAVPAFYDAMGVDTVRLTIEQDSRNTYENAVNLKSLVDASTKGTWLLVTTAWHMPRSVGAFRQAGLTVLPYPVDHNTCPGRLLRVEWCLAEHLFGLKIAIREWVGLFVYRLTGKTSALLPGP